MTTHFLLLGFLVAILIAFTIAKPTMLWAPDTWKAMAIQFPEFGVFTLGVMLCFIIGCIDVSFVALGNFASILACLLMRTVTDGTLPESDTGLIVLLSILVALVIGGLGGLLNGSLISRLGIPPILATLATQMVFRGLSIALTRGDAVTGIPEIYGEIGHIYLFGIFRFDADIHRRFLICAFLLKYVRQKAVYDRRQPQGGPVQRHQCHKDDQRHLQINSVIAAISALLMVKHNSAKRTLAARI